MIVIEMNNEKCSFRKALVAAIVLLFVGVSVAPSINADINKALDENDFIEITIEVCGIKGINPHTVKLTKQEVNEVEDLFDDLKRKIEQANTKDEVIDILNVAIKELDKYDLLPDGISIKQAQSLVMGQHQNSKVFNLLEKVYKIQRKDFDDNENVLCLIAGGGCHFFESYLSFASRRVSNIFGELESWASGKDLKNLAHLFYSFTKLFGLNIPTMLFFFGLVNPICFGNIIHYGILLNDNWEDPSYTPSDGWVYTYGLNGLRTWSNNDLNGNLPIKPLELGSNEPLGLGDTIHYPGVLGFTGIKFGPFYYLGSAVWVKIGTEPPE